VPARRSPQITPRSLTEGYDHFGVWPQLRKAAKKLACGSYFWDGNEKVLIKPMLMSTQNYSFGRHKKCLKTIVSSLRSGRELFVLNTLPSLKDEQENLQDDNIEPVVNGGDLREDAALILKEFGPQLIELGYPIWKIQANALESSTFLKAR
jgi:hypothetical protein